MRIRPFADEEGFTPFSNYMLDVIMPGLPANAWKVLCFILRKTRGWQKDMDRLSYGQIETGAGIGSSATVRSAIKVLLEKNYIVQVPGSAWKPMGYSLNSTLEIEAQDGSALETKALEIEVHSTLETEAHSTLEIEVIKRKSLQKEKQRERESRAPPKQVSIDSLHEGVAIYRRLTGKRTVPPIVATAIAEKVTDCPRFENAATAWIKAGYKPDNITGIMDWYEHPEKMERRNGTHQDSRHANAPSRRAAPKRLDRDDTS